MEDISSLLSARSCTEASLKASAMAFDALGLKIGGAFHRQKTWN
jgi:hypothetical protein